MHKFSEFLSEKYFKTDVGTRFLPSGSGSFSKMKNSAIEGFRNKVDDLHKTLSAHYPRAEGGIKGTVRNYTEHSTPLNTYLHKNHSDPKSKDEGHDYTAQVLSNHVSEIKAPKTFHVYSGLHESPETGHDVKEESDHYKAHLPAFTSASIDPEITTMFSSSAHDEKSKEATIYHHHVLKIEIPKGSTHGRYIDHDSVNKGEKEFLIDKGKNIHISKEHQIIKQKGFSPHGQPKQYIHIHVWHAKIV